MPLLLSRRRLLLSQLRHRSSCLSTAACLVPFYTHARVTKEEGRIVMPRFGLRARRLPFGCSLVGHCLPFVRSSVLGDFYLTDILTCKAFLRVHRSHWRSISPYLFPRLALPTITYLCTLLRFVQHLAPTRSPSGCCISLRFYRACVHCALPAVVGCFRRTSALPFALRIIADAGRDSSFAALLVATCHSSVLAIPRATPSV